MPLPAPVDRNYSRHVKGTRCPDGLKNPSGGPVKTIKIQVPRNPFSAAAHTVRESEDQRSASEKLNYRHQGIRAAAAVTPMDPESPPPLQ